MTQKTILNEAHRRLGARMVDFGGWDMPLNYGSQIEEHHAVRQDCGMFDVSHMCAVDIAGRDAHAYLLRLLAGNIDKLTIPGKALYCTMLNERGGVVDDLIAFYLRDGHYRLVINAGTAEKDIDWMRAKLEEWGLAVGIMARRDLAIIAVQGPNAKARVWELYPETRAATENLKPFFCAEVGDFFLSTTGYTGEEGFEISLPVAQAEAFWQKLLDASVRPAGLAARDTLRLEAGMNLYGQDMDENVSPLDAGLAWTVDLKAERDFVGKAALLAQGAQKTFLGLVLEDKGGVLRAHQTVYTADGEGETTSGSFSPSLQQSIALARLPRGAAAGQTVEVDIRGKRLKARLVKPGFVRLGKALV